MRNISDLVAAAMAAVDARDVAEAKRPGSAWTRLRKQRGRRRIEAAEADRRAKMRGEPRALSRTHPARRLRPHRGRKSSTPERGEPLTRGLRRLPRSSSCEAARGRERPSRRWPLSAASAATSDVA